MKVLLANGNLLTMTDGWIRYRWDLVMEQGKITEIDKDIPVSEDMTVIDCTGKYIMPGLMDAHVHFDSEDMGEMFILNGVTTVRNMEGCKRHLRLSREIKQRKRTGPYLYSAGPLYDGKQTWERNKLVTSKEEAELAVEETAAGGFLWVKTYSSIPGEAYIHLMKYAGRRGIKVCGHMSYEIDAKVLADLGYYAVEHSSSLPSHKADIRYLAEAGMWFCPTQVVCETLPDYVWDGKQLKDIKNYRYLSSVIRRRWEKKNESIIEGYKEKGIKPDIGIIIERGKEFLSYSDRVMVGTDCMYPGILAGFSIHDELERMVKLYGCTSYEALRMATVNPALHMGIEDKKGKLKTGMDADILVLHENPLSDIGNTRSVYIVIQGETVYDLKTMEAIRRHLEETEREIEIVFE